MPGHGKEEVNKGDIESWEINDQAVKDAFKDIEKYDNKVLIGHSYGG